MDRNELKERLKGLAYDCNADHRPELCLVLKMIAEAVEHDQDAMLYANMLIAQTHLLMDRNLKAAIRDYQKKNTPE